MRDHGQDQSFCFAEAGGGAGGFSQALAVCGALCVYYVDISPKWQGCICNGMNDLFREPEGQHLIDVRVGARVGWSRIKTLHRIMTEFTCQPWSLAGKRAGWEDPKCVMYYAVFEMIYHFRPCKELAESTEGLLQDGVPAIQAAPCLMV